MRRRLSVILCALLLLACSAQAEVAFQFSFSGDHSASEPPVETLTDPAEIMAQESTQETEAIQTTAGEDTYGGMILTPSNASGESIPAASTEPVEILISAAGDVTIGGNMRKNPSSNMYTKIMAAQDNNLAYFFANVYDIFAHDDMTLVNFEGTLTEATDHKDNEFCFRAPPEHIQILPLGSIEAVAFENNHVMDFRQRGYDDTIAMFEQYGIVYSTEAHVGVFETKGVTIAMLAYQTFDGAYPRLNEQVPQDVAQAKAQYDIVIVSYHWGAEKDYAPNDNQIKLGRATIDAGADLVLGHHSHRLNPIEQYNGRYIVYSLGNCSFSGHTGPDDMDTFIFQQKFIVQNGVASSGAFRVIPCSISSSTAASGKESGDNDLAVTPFPEGSDAAQRVIDKLMKHGQSLTYAVSSYPTQW